MPADEPVGTPPGSAISEQAPSAPGSPKAASLEITMASTASKPVNGKVEVVLSVLQRDTKGISSTPPKITEWRIDDAVQKGEGDRPLTGSTLPMALTEGIHKVAVTSTADGRPLKAEVDVDVKIKRTEESNVQVRPAAR